MAAFPRSPVLIRHLPTGGGIAAGALAALAVVFLSTDALEHLVWVSGIAALVPAAQPPLGATARLMLALGAGAVAGAVVWSVLFLLFGPGGFLVPKTARQARPAVRPVVRRADAHPDAPPRRPMTAADLGTPLMEVATTPSADVEPERAWPSRLDQPLAAFDPDAVPIEPREPQRVLPALAPGERLDTFPLTPPPPPSVFSTRPVKRETTAQTIDSLLRRLEEGAGRRAARL